MELKTMIDNSREWERLTKDGHHFKVFRTETFFNNDEYEYETMIVAGCRYFTVAEAEKHWTKPVEFWIGKPSEWNYNGFASAAEYNKAAKKREKLNQERLNFIAKGVNYVEQRK
jgi:hypothetical protein